MPDHVEINPRMDVAAIPNTSASTGLPKGACISHFALMVGNYDAKSLDVLRWTFMSPMSNFAIGSYVASASSITNGATIVHLGKFVKDEYLQQLLKYKVRECTHFGNKTKIYSLLCKIPSCFFMNGQKK
jgi:acyl-CoA synthetase (AMP-forming)/AMP-acid ligase II